ncbi:nSTAND1 domain-containing NTPase [Modestobacter marinus]|uniref:nSTAND1 domain-containing NTPase n=1 Tax=Modestobacter marinus TaxID=477641 RepID=UPI001C953D1E|nr:TIR domain-containing protein [Modestobacter marinus]
MARVFVSHSSRDAALAADVHRWLVDEGHEAFLDQDLSDGILAGEEWEKRLHERLRWADAVVCVLTSAYLASVWCTAELAIAQSRGSRLLPIRAEYGLRHPLLDSVQYVDLTLDAAAARARVIEALLRVDAAGGYGRPDDRSPFPGLRPLDTDEHSVFFGRAREIDELATLLRSPAEQAYPAVLVVVGPSGCGKSSLVRAGLLPVMAAEPGWWTLPAILPGTQPVAALARELAASAHQLGLAWTVTDVRRRLDAGDLTGLVDDLLLAVPGRRRRHLLIVVDQFEELLTQTGLQQRAQFAELLRDALAGPMRVVATLRPEFLEPLLASSDLSALPTRTHILRPLRPEALRAVIEGPADRAGITIDAELVPRLVADTGGGEALPLLAYTLAQLADGVTRGGRLTTTRYEQLGEVHGVLVRQADAALADALAAGGRSREEVIRELLRLVTVDEQGRPTRWRVPRDELPRQVLTELQPFIDRRLLTTDTEGGHVVLGVAHEAFLSAWPPLIEAIAAAASALRARRQVEQAAAQWIEDGHASSRLWERGQLAAALADTGARLQSHRGAPKAPPAGDGFVPHRRSPVQWRRGHRTLVAERVELSARARDFLAASIRRDRRRRNRAVTTLSVLLVLALGAAAFAIGQQRSAEERQRLATARLLVTQAESSLDRDPRTALRMGEAALRIHPSSETESALVRNVLTTPYTGTLTGSVYAVAFAPNGHILATVSAEDSSSVILWDTADPAAPQRLGAPLSGHTGWVSEVVFARDGHTLATAGADGTLLWDVTDPAAPQRLGAPLSGHTGGVYAVAFAPNGHILATAGGDDGTLILWDITDPAAPRQLGSPFTGHSLEVNAVAFARNGHILATAGSDDLGGSFVILWDITDPAAPRRLGSPLTGYSGVVHVAFAPDGHAMVTADAGATVILWDVTDPAVPQRLGSSLSGHTGGVYAVAFAPNGHTLATAGANGTLLWDITDPAVPQRLGSSLSGHTGGVYAVAFAPNGHTLATAGYDTVILWELTDPAAPQQLGAPLSGHTSGVGAVAFAPNKHILATAGFDESNDNSRVIEDSTVVLWDVTNPATPQRLGSPLRSSLGMVFALVFAPNGRTLVTAGADGTVLWDISDPAAPRQLGAPLTGHPGAVIDVAFAPDGHILATAGADDGAIILWDTTDPAAPQRLGAPLSGHTGGVSEVAFVPDGHTLGTAGADDGAIILWDTTDPAAPQRLGAPLSGHTGGVSEVAFVPDGHTLGTAGADDGAIILWDTTDPAAPQRLGAPLSGHTGEVSEVAFAPDGHILATAGGDDGTLILWDTTDPAAPRRLGSSLTGHTGGVWEAAFVSNGHILATVGNDGIILWDIADPARPQRLSPRLPDGVYEVAFAPNGHTMATGGRNGTVILWDFTGLQSLRAHAIEHACAITGGSFSHSEWAKYVPGLKYIDACGT